MDKYPKEIAQINSGNFQLGLDYQFTPILIFNSDKNVANVVWSQNIKNFLFSLVESSVKGHAFRRKGRTFLKFCNLYFVANSGEGVKNIIYRKPFQFHPTSCQQ